MGPPGLNWGISKRVKISWADRIKLDPKTNPNRKERYPCFLNSEDVSIIVIVYVIVSVNLGLTVGISRILILLSKKSQIITFNFIPFFVCMKKKN